MSTIAILGYGTVGTGLVELLDKNNLKDTSISSILVKNKDKHKNKKYFNLVTDDIDQVFNSPSEIFIEVMGGIHPAYEYVKKALKNNKHVITANKDLIAEHGRELISLAKENHVYLNFEASVGGGIPILKPLIESLCGNKISKITAILNGTTNFILTKMYNENMDYDEALRLAQDLGFAESDPTSDVEGLDSARKLSILSTIAFKKLIKWNDIFIEGISDLKKEDFIFAKSINCCIKLLAVSSYENDKVMACVKPMFVPLSNSISQVEDEFNTINLYGDAVGDLNLYGKGAGMLPTASSVYSDLLDIINHNNRLLEFSNNSAIVESPKNFYNEIIVKLPRSNKTYILEFNKLFNKNIVQESEFEDFNIFYLKADDALVFNDKIKFFSIKTGIIPKSFIKL